MKTTSIPRPLRPPRLVASRPVHQLTARLHSWCAAFLAVLVATAAITVEAASPKVINEVPYTINKSGQYALGKSLSYSGSGAAIQVNADDVTIDLRGYVLSSPFSVSSSAQTAGIFSEGRTNVVIRNGVVRGFFRGVFLEGETNSRANLVEDVHADQCTFLGIQVKGASSIVRHNRVTSVGGSTSYAAYRYGIHVTGLGVRVSENDVSDVVHEPGQWAIGIFVVGEASVIERNRVTNHTVQLLDTSVGIMSYFSPVSIIDDNDVIRFGTGIRADTCVGANVRDNSVTGCSVGYDINSVYVDGGGNH